MTWTHSNSPAVLIVDDVPDNLAVLSDALDGAGYLVLVAESGQSALDRLSHVTPDLILLDAVMPGLDGFETCRRIKCLPTSSHVPVVFMTGLVETEHVVRGFASGGVDYVTKPIQPQEVLVRVDTHIRNAQMLCQARSALDASSEAVVMLDSATRIVWMNGRASSWMRDYFPDAAADGRFSADLPTDIQVWIDDHLMTLSGRDSPMLPAEYSVAGKSGTLSLTLSAGARNGGYLLTMHELRSASPARVDLSSLRAYCLTPREVDVLSWVAKGKTNRDIADIVGMSPRTVNKHLEHIYVKLGVETRSAAAAMALGGWHADSSRPASSLESRH